MSFELGHAEFTLLNSRDCSTWRVIFTPAGEKPGHWDFKVFRRFASRRVGEGQTSNEPSLKEAEALIANFANR